MLDICCSSALSSDMVSKKSGWRSCDLASITTAISYSPQQYHISSLGHWDQGYICQLHPYLHFERTTSSWYANAMHSSQTVDRFPSLQPYLHPPLLCPLAWPHLTPPSSSRGSFGDLRDRDHYYHLEPLNQLDASVRGWCHTLCLYNSMHIHFQLNWLQSVLWVNTDQGECHYLSGNYVCVSLQLNQPHALYLDSEHSQQKGTCGECAGLGIRYQF